MAFGLGVPELVVIGLIAVFIFGGKRFANLGRDLGAGIRNLRDSLGGSGSEGKAKGDNDGEEI